MILKDTAKYFKEVKNARPMQETLIRKCEGFIPETKKLDYTD
jgi:hypothetical protein